MGVKWGRYGLCCWLRVERSLHYNSAPSAWESSISRVQTYSQCLSPKESIDEANEQHLTRYQAPSPVCRQSSRCDHTIAWQWYCPMCTQWWLIHERANGKVQSRRILLLVKNHHPFHLTLHLSMVSSMSILIKYKISLHLQQKQNLGHSSSIQKQISFPLEFKTCTYINPITQTNTIIIR